MWNTAVCTQMASFILFPSTFINFTLKSTPIVAGCSVSKVSSVNRKRRLADHKEKSSNSCGQHFFSEQQSLPRFPNSALSCNENLEGSQHWGVHIRRGRCSERNSVKTWDDETAVLNECFRLKAASFLCWRFSGIRRTRFDCLVWPLGCESNRNLQL